MVIDGFMEELKVLDNKMLGASLLIKKKKDVGVCFSFVGKIL